MLRGPSVRVVDDISPIIHFVIKKVIVTQNQPIPVSGLGTFLGISSRTAGATSMRLTNLPAESHQFTRYDVYPVAKAGMDESLTDKWTRASNMSILPVETLDGIWYDIDMARHEAELLNQCSEVQDS